jgi:heterodisulfide reductase subunit A
MAALVKQHNPDIDITVFYMDIQNTGKDFAAFYGQCQADFRFVRTIPVDFFPTADDGLKTRYMAENDGRPLEEEFDMAVLSIGIMPADDSNRLAELFNVDLNEDGFVAARNSLDKGATSEDGVFVAGTAEGPKDIAASKAHAGMTAQAVSAYLRGAK